MSADSQVCPFRLYRIMDRLRHVHRFQRHRVLFPQSVAEHSYAVAMLAGVFQYQLWRRGVVMSRLDVIEGALWHDAAEAVVGDLPADIKWSSGLGESWDALEHSVLAGIGRFNGGTPPAAVDVADNRTMASRVVKLADRVELLLFIQAERQAGNQSLNVGSYKTWGALRDHRGTWPRPEVNEWYAGVLEQLEFSAPCPDASPEFYPDSVFRGHAHA